MGRPSRWALVALLAVPMIAGCSRGRVPAYTSQAVPADWPQASGDMRDAVSWVSDGPEPDVPGKLPRGAQEMLEANGFVVLGDVEAHNLKDAYFATMRGNFITADAVLYVFHCLFRGGFSIYEKKNLVPLCERVSELGLGAAKERAKSVGSDPLLAEPARRNVVFFAVAKGLMEGASPTDGGDEARELYERIMAAEETEFYPGEDYTTYKPRGVYAEDEDLAHYFRAMKWLSRVILPIVPGATDREPDASIKLRQAHLLGEMLRGAELKQAWQELYDEIGFFIAEPDSFTPVRFYEVSRHIPDFPSDAWVAAVREEFAKPEYPRSKIVPVPQGNPGDAPWKYVQLMGERYIPDAQIHGEAVFPHVAGRTVPKGLDIAYALFNSPRARVHLQDEFSTYGDLEPALDRLHQEFATYASEAEPASIYAGWIGAVRAVLHPTESEHVPGFFHTDPWRDKSLTTALASWTHMRHDFVLYAKQHATPRCGSQMFLIEPIPEAYARLELLAGRLQQRGFPGMESYGELCRVLKEVSRCQIVGEDWHQQKSIDGEWNLYLNAFGQWLLANFSDHVPEERPSIVVDVHSDSNPPNPVLHEATGPFNLIVARNADFPNMPYQGWVLSYYEFTEHDWTRLTDSDWRERVNAGKHGQARPGWVASYMHGH